MFSDQKLIKNLLIYIGIILLSVVIYLLSSFVAIVLFVVLSAYHFGEEHLSHKINVNFVFNAVYFLSYGLFIFALLFYQSMSDVDVIMTELTGRTFSKIQIELTLIVSAIFLSIGSVYLILMKRNESVLFLREFLYLVLLFLVFNTSSLILGFAIYFILWHSIPSIIHQIEFISGNLNKRNVVAYVKKALIYWVISIAGLLVLYQLLPEIKILATVVFVILFAVTAPHTWVMHRMKN